MKLSRVFFALAVLVALAVATVAAQVRAVRAGYRLHALEVERERLTEEARRLELVHARESGIEKLKERARRLGLPLPGEEGEEAEQQ